MRYFTRQHSKEGRSHLDMEASLAADFAASSHCWKVSCAQCYSGTKLAENRAGTGIALTMCRSIDSYCFLCIGAF